MAQILGHYRVIERAKRRFPQLFKISPDSVCAPCDQSLANHAKRPRRQGNEGPPGPGAKAKGHEGEDEDEPEVVPDYQPEGSQVRPSDNADRRFSMKRTTARTSCFLSLTRVALAV